jgi:hypothetical protein
MTAPTTRLAVHLSAAIHIEAPPQAEPDPALKEFYEELRGALVGTTMALLRVHKIDAKVHCLPRPNVGRVVTEVRS